MMRTRIETVVWLVFVGCAIAFAPAIAPLNRLFEFLMHRPQPYLGITIAMTTAGVGLFIAAGLAAVFRRGRRMTDTEAQAYAAASLRVPNYAFYRGYFRGRAGGRQVEAASDFSAAKEAFRTGAWLRDAGWRSFLLMVAGALLWLYGGFGIAIVLGPPAVKLIVAATMLYFSARLICSMWRA
jgi:hypothetical protein